MKNPRIMLIILLLFFLAGCGAAAPSSPDQSDNSTSQENSPTPTQPPNPLQKTNTPESVDLSSIPAEKYIALGKRDLASRLSVDVSAITLLEAVEVTWPDAALGCPKPGMVYAQGKVPGHRIRLEAQGQEFEYHTAYSGDLVLCLEQNPDNLEPLLPGSAGPTPNIGVPID